jgi:uncharacterized protein (DUF1778 family)
MFSKEILMLPTTPTTARLEARISADLHANIKLVADMQDRSMTDFIVSAMQEAVQRVIEQRDVVKLSLEDQVRFANAILLPPVTNPALKRAFAKHRDMVVAE